VPSLDPVVSNTTPLVKLVGIGLLDLLPTQYQEIHVPKAVFTEYQSGRAKPPGSSDLATLSWIIVHAVATDPAVSTSLDLGEMQAISLARTLNARLLLLDERCGRAVAEQLGLPVAGSLTILLEAKRQGHIPLVAPIINQMIARGRRISPRLRAEGLRRAGE
jgi:predicted nucleic acid-binding protein